MLIIWQILVLLPTNSQKWKWKWTDSGQHMCNQATLSGFRALLTVRFWPPVRWLKAHRISQPSSPSSLASCCGRHQATTPAVVWCIFNEHKHMLITKSCCMSTHLSPAPTPGPCFWNAICHIVKIWQWLTGFASLYRNVLSSFLLSALLSIFLPDG